VEGKPNHKAARAPNILVIETGLDKEHVVGAHGKTAGRWFATCRAS